MVHCVVVGCSHRSPRDTKKGITFHRFPLKDQRRLSICVANIKRENMPPLKNAIICSAHFELSCFEKDFREKLMPGSYGRSRSLRANAIPTIFSHTKSANERPASERRKRKACHEEVSAALILIRKNPILSSAK